MGRNHLSVMKVLYKPQRIAIRPKSNGSAPGISRASGQGSNSGNTNEKLKSPIYHSFNKRRFRVHISEKQKVKKNLFGSSDPARDYQNTSFHNNTQRILADKLNRQTVKDHSKSSSSLGSRTLQRMMSLQEMLKPEKRRKRSVPVSVERKRDDSQAIPGTEFEIFLRKKFYDCEGIFDDVWNIEVSPQKGRQLESCPY